MTVDFYGLARLEAILHSLFDIILRNEAKDKKIWRLMFKSSRSATFHQEKFAALCIKNLTTYQREEFFDWISVLKIVFLNLFLVGRRFLLF